MTVQQTAATPGKRASAKRVLLASLTGSSIEWFDYFLYGTTAALVFNKLFFPNFDPVVGLMLSYLSFALTFFIRPLGGLIFAHIGDRIGRKKTLVITLSLMGGATVGIGLLPGYDYIGVWAPILLVLLRLIQGLGIGGEWGGGLVACLRICRTQPSRSVWQRAANGGDHRHVAGHAGHDLDEPVA